MTGLTWRTSSLGYRVVARTCARRLELNACGYIIETEMLLKASPHSTHFRHVPVRAIYGGPSHTGRFATRGSFRGGRCITRRSNWIDGCAVNPNSNIPSPEGVGIPTSIAGRRSATPS